MFHVLRMIQRRREGRPLPYALPLAALAGSGLLAGLLLAVLR